MVPNHQAVMADRHVDNVNVYRLNPVDMVEPGKWILQDEKQFDHVKLNVNIIIYIYMIIWLIVMLDGKCQTKCRVKLNVKRYDDNG